MENNNHEQESNYTQPEKYDNPNKWVGSVFVLLFLGGMLYFLFNYM